MAIDSSPCDITPNELIIRSTFMYFGCVNAFIAAPIIASVCVFVVEQSVWSALNPLSYTIVMAPLLIFYTNKEQNYEKIVMIHQILILILPISLQYMHGGLLNSKGMMVGSFLCPLGAALFCTSVVAIRWFAIYMVIFLGLFLVEYTWYCSSPTSSTGDSGDKEEPLSLSPLECVFFFMNFGGVLAIVCSVALSFRIKLDNEYRRSERLIDNILPRSIAKRLKEGESHIIENFDQVTILFADLVGFTAAAVAATANQPSFFIGLFLRDVFSAWDQLLIERNIDKIKTIGDAFMAVGGIEENQHGIASIRGGNTSYTTRSEKTRNDFSQRTLKEVSIEMVLLALEMQQALQQVNKRYGLNFKCRIGMHSGPVIGGVIGVKKFAFDVWGDAVNTASRMESHGIPDYLQMSSDMYKDVIATISDLGINVTCRGNIEVKGKGTMKTYLIHMSQENQIAVDNDASPARTLVV